VSRKEIQKSKIKRQKAKGKNEELRMRAIEKGMVFIFAF
jgi:hypothetical protein